MRRRCDRRAKSEVRAYDVEHPFRLFKDFTIRESHHSYAFRFEVRGPFPILGCPEAAEVTDPSSSTAIFSDGQ
jgi:hypothetical protein